MGAVYEAYDQERHETVALKTLRWQDPSAIYRLKKEFRVLRYVAHPNLALLYELVADRDDWFYTMELVDGSEFFDDVRPAAPSQSEATRATSRPLVPPDVPRLRAALAQLVAGVVALHRAGIVHRDLKPSNVLVTPAGRVVILDFGLADVAAPPSRLQTREEGLWGTAAYMAPEQVEGERGPPSDWYAVGVMLYEALTGRLPFEGSALRVLADKSRQDPPRPSDLVPELPQDLVTLCGDLMARDPAARPEDGEVLRRTGVSDATSGAEAHQPGRPALLIGREAELAELRDAFRTVCSGQAVAVYVHGASGIGKTALIRHFVDALEREALELGLRGRCYERESVPYKAVDGVIDSVSRYLKTLSGPQVQALLPEGVSALARLFPVLLRIEAVGDARVGEREPADPLELRRRGFACLRELLTQLSAQQPALVFIDDLQWADRDSMVLLEEVLRPPDPPHVLLIASFRTEDLASQSFLRALLATLAVAGRPVDAKVARTAAGLEGDDRPLVALLIKAHFLRSLGAPSRLELYHDRIRETLVAALAPQAAAGIHLRLAQCSEELLGHEDPEALFEHYVAAGDRDRAAVYAARAADKAFAALAFDRAVLLYERALELTPPGPADLSALRGRLGDALASAGRCPAAAQAYLAAAGAGASEGALQYQRRAAGELLISGHPQAGAGGVRTG